MKTFTSIFLAFALLVPISVSNAVQKNIISSSKADAVRQNRQQRFGIRAFQNKGEHIRVQKKNDVRQTSPSSSHIYGPERLRFGIDRHDDTNTRQQSQSRMQPDGTDSPRRVTERRGSISYKLQVRKLKGTR